MVKDLNRYSTEYDYFFKNLKENKELYNYAKQIENIIMILMNTKFNIIDIHDDQFGIDKNDQIKIFDLTTK